MISKVSIQTLRLKGIQDLNNYFVSFTLTSNVQYIRFYALLRHYPLEALMLFKCKIHISPFIKEYIIESIQSSPHLNN